MEHRSPCASCKLRRRRCPTDCIFAPYFPSDYPEKFAVVHNIFGTSRASKRLKGLPVHQRGDVVSSLVYEANAWVRDPVYGCVGDIFSLKNQLAEAQNQVSEIRKELDVAQNQVSELRKQLDVAQAQELQPNHEADKDGKDKEAFETASGVAAVGDISLLQNQVSKVQTQLSLAQAQIPCIQNHEGVKVEKGKEAFESAQEKEPTVFAAAGERKHEAAEKHNMKFPFDLNKLPSDEDEDIMP